MKVWKALDENLEKVLCGIILAAMTFCILMQVVIRITREWTGISLAWTEELARYLFVWLIYISSSMAVKLRAHIKVDVLRVAVGRRGKFIFDLISNVMFVFFSAIFFYYSGVAVHRLIFLRPQSSPTLHVPMWAVYSAITVGCLLMFIRLIQDIIKLVQEYKSGAADTSEREAL